MKDIQKAFQSTFDRLKLASLFLVLFLLYTGIPPSVWLEVYSIHVEDSQVGVTPIMKVDRRIKQPFFARWEVELEREEVDGFIFITKQEGSNDYTTDAVFPKILTMDWWTYPSSFVDKLKKGRYRITTCWTIIVPVIEDRRLCVTSNTFTIRGNE